MSKPISQLDPLTDLATFVIPGIEGAGPTFLNVKTSFATSVRSILTADGVVKDAPSDGKNYVRAGNAWVVDPIQADAANDGKAYARQSLAWIETLSKTAIDTKNSSQDTAIATKIGDAPSDGKQYARKNAAWAEVTQPPPATYIGDAPPSSPVAGQLWWESDTGSTWIYYNDGNTTQWVQISAIGTTTPLSDAPVDGKSYGRKDASWNEVLPITGGGLAGNLQLNPSGNGDLVVNAASSSNYSRLILRQGGAERFQLFVNNAAGQDVYGQVIDDSSVSRNVISFGRADGITSIRQGAKFPVLSTDAAALDYYGEAAWVPTLKFNNSSTGFVYSRQQGRYQRVGNTVHWWAGIKLTAKGSGVGLATLDGLPFPANSGANAVSYYTGAFGFTGGMTSVTAPSVIVQAGGTFALMYVAGNGAQMTDANFTATTQMELGGSYEVA